MPEQTITIPLSRWNAALGLLALVISIGVSAWGGAALAIDSRADAAVERRIARSGLVNAQDLQNATQLQELRLQAIERSINRLEQGVEYLVRREIEAGD